MWAKQLETFDEFREKQSRENVWTLPYHALAWSFIYSYQPLLPRTVRFSRLDRWCSTMFNHVTQAKNHIWLGKTLLESSLKAVIRFFFHNQTATVEKYVFSFFQIYTLGSKDGAAMRALASHPCRSDSIPAQCHMWVEFVVGSRLAPRVFLWILRFPSLHKNQHLQIPTRLG